MSYIIFYTETGRRVAQSYKVRGTALNAMRSLNKRAGYAGHAISYIDGVAVEHCTKDGVEPGNGPYSMAHSNDYQRLHGNRTHTVINLMSGKEVQESINTPYSCSVASEAYWCN